MKDALDSDVTGGGGGGGGGRQEVEQSAPWHFSPREFLLTYWEKKDKEDRVNGEETKENLKQKRWKNWKWNGKKYENE